MNGTEILRDCGEVDDNITVFILCSEKKKTTK
jgi:hypothetical protein